MFEVRKVNSRKMVWWNIKWNGWLVRWELMGNEVDVIIIRLISIKLKVI